MAELLMCNYWALLTGWSPLEEEEQLVKCFGFSDAYKFKKEKKEKRPQ